MLSLVITMRLYNFLCVHKTFISTQKYAHRLVICKRIGNTFIIVYLDPDYGDLREIFQKMLECAVNGCVVYSLYCVDGIEVNKSADNHSALTFTLTHTEGVLCVHTR